MRTGIDARLLAYRRGGISEYTRQLVQALMQLDRENDYWILHSRRDRSDDDYTANFRRSVIWTPPHHRLERTLLSLEMLRFPLDVFHSPDFIPPWRVARHHLITIHDLHFLHYPQFQTADSLRYYRDQINAAVQHADHIFAQTETTRREIIEKLQVPGEKITVHLLGVNPAFDVLTTEEIDEKLTAYHLPAEYLFFVGTIEPRKNIPGLLKAYEQLCNWYADIPPLVLAGQKGWHSDESLEAINRLADRVRWLESVPFDILPALYNRAKILILPSFYEGFGLPAIEAMACGTPVVISERGALPEVAGEHAIYVDPDEPESIAAGIRTLLEDSLRYDTLRESGLVHARTYTWQRTAQITLDVYQKIAGTG